MTTDRFTIARNLERDASAIISGIWTEVRAMRPFGVASEVSLVIGARPKRGVLHHIPGTGATVVFAKVRQPSREQLDRWEESAKKAEELRARAVRLSCWGAIAHNRTIGNRLILERGLALQADGLTTPEEDRFIELLSRFWTENPNANGGIVRHDRIEVLA